MFTEEAGLGWAERRVLPNHTTQRPLCFQKPKHGPFRLDVGSLKDQGCRRQPPCHHPCGYLAHVPKSCHIWIPESRFWAQTGAYQHRNSPSKGINKLEVGGGGRVEGWVGVIVPETLLTLTPPTENGQLCPHRCPVPQCKEEVAVVRPQQPQSQAAVCHVFDTLPPGILRYVGPDTCGHPSFSLPPPSSALGPG